MSTYRHNGFSLIELMMVVVIIGILAAIAYPSYQDSVTKTRRSDGQAMLLELMNAQERYFTENGAYTDDLSKIAAVNGDGDVDSDEEFYKISAGVCDNTTPISVCVNLTATPGTAQSADGPLSYNSRGVKDPPEKW